MRPVSDQHPRLARMDAWTWKFRLWAPPLMGPPFLVSAVLIPCPPGTTALLLAAFTPSTIVLMWEQARTRRWHPPADEKTPRRIAVGVVAVVAAVVAAYYAMQMWGGVGCALGAIAWYGAMWAAARKYRRAAARHERATGSNDRADDRGPASRRARSGRDHLRNQR